MFESLPKQLLDQDIDQIFQVIIKKSTDSNVFMGESAEKALMSLCRNIPETKLLPSLLALKGHK
jgi:hypothetical protein